MPTRRMPLNLTDEERQTPQRWARRPKSSQRLATPCQIIPLSEQGWTYARIGQKLDLRRRMVLRWRERFLASLLDELHDESRPRYCGALIRCGLCGNESIAAWSFFRAAMAIAPSACGSIGYSSCGSARRS